MHALYKLTPTIIFTADSIAGFPRVQKILFLKSQLAHVSIQHQHHEPFQPLPRTGCVMAQFLCLTIIYFESSFCLHPTLLLIEGTVAVATLLPRVRGFSQGGCGCVCFYSGPTLNSFMLLMQTARTFKEVRQRLHLLLLFFHCFLKLRPKMKVFVY